MRPLNDLINPHLRALDGYASIDPVDVLAKQAGIPPEQVIRLNGNETPYGPSPRVLDVLSKFKGHHLYPDPQQRRIRAALSMHLNVEEDRILCGAGSDELIDLLLRLVITPGDTVVEPVPTFGMYSFNAAVCGGRAVSVPRDDRFEIDVDAVRKAVQPNTKIIFLASPNNPTGNPATVEQVRALLALGPLVVADEAYHEFYGKSLLPLVKDHPNLIVLRTFSKWAGLAGLRIGYGVMDPQLVRTLMVMKPPYNISVVAEEALVASLEDRDVLMGRVRQIVAERERLVSQLKTLPQVSVWPSQANFVLINVPAGRGKDVYQSLARRGVFTRYFSHPRLRDCVRISIGLHQHTDRVISALRETLAEL